MHKIYLNDKEIEIISNASEVIDKIGGFPSMENGELISYSINKVDDYYFDVELVFDISGWLRSVSFYLDTPDKHSYEHKVFNEKRIKLLFHNCLETNISFPISHNGEIKFGGIRELDERNRRQVVLPSVVNILEGPYCCFYMCTGRELFIRFDDKCKITAKLY